jgi:hypothetical protein
MKTSPEDIQDIKTDNLNGSFSRTGKYRVVGSQSLRAIPYDDKYELTGGKSGGDGEALAEMLQEAYADALKHPDYTITDFHAGIDDRLFYRGDYTKNSVDEYLAEHKHLIPIRKASMLRQLSGEDLIKQIRSLYLLSWSQSEVKRGKKKMIDGKTKLLKDAVLDKTPIKIEILGKVGDQFVEVTETISLDGSTTTEQDQMGDVEDEVHFFSQSNCFKALKRFYSALQLHPEKENEPAMAKMVDFFNSQMGILNKIRNELGVVEKILTHKKAKWNDVLHNLEHIKKSVPKEDGVFSTFTDMTEHNALTKVREMIDYLSGVLNDHSRIFLKSIAEL